MKPRYCPHFFLFLLASLPLLTSATLWAGDRAERWSGPVGATVTLQVDMPTWTEGWLKSGVSWENVQAPQNTSKIKGRDVDEQSHHVLLMRTKEGINGPHSWSPAALVMNDRWKSKVYNEPWPKVSDLAEYQAGNDGPAAGGEDQEYRRFQPYVNWSE